MKSKIIENKIEFIENLFAVLFMIYSVLSCNGWTYGKLIIKPFMWSSLLLAVVILIYRLFHIKNYFQLPSTIFSLMTVASICISTLLNRKYSFKNNAIFCVYWVIYFLVLFTADKNRKKDSCKKTFRLISATFIIYTTVSVIISFILYFAGVSKTYTVPEAHYAYNIGFKWGRLWGIFINPNHGAISCAISVIFIIYILSNYKKLWIRIVSALGILLHLLYIVFADSRSGAIVLSIGIATYAFAIALKVLQNRKAAVKLLAFVTSLCLAVLCFMGVRQLKKPINSTISFINSQFERKDNNSRDDIIERGYDISEDISNRRFDVWKSGIEVFTHSSNKMVFGLSYCGFTEYAENNIPNTYIVDNDYAVMTTLDNELLNILISNGIFGILSALAFVTYIIVFVVKRFITVRSEEKYFVALNLAILFSLACAAMFSSVMFYYFSPNAIIFWFVLGQLTAYLNCKENSDA